MTEGTDAQDAVPADGERARRARPVSFVVAIDGPAGSGKSTLASGLAAYLGCAHLDTGAMYRAVALAVLQRGIDPADARAVTAVAEGLDLDVGERVIVDGEDVTAAIRTPEVDACVSHVAAHADVRSTLVGRQRSWARAQRGGVVEGRDIGSVVFPDAAVKIFLTAEESERARRRAAERRVAAPAGDVAATLARRDAFDSSRSASPLVVPRGAVVLDTSEMSAPEVLAAAIALLPAPESRKDPEYTFGYAFLRNLAVGLARAVFRLRVHHAERVPQSGGFIVAPVHRSNLDFLLAGTAVRHRKMWFMAKEEVWKSRLLGNFVEAHGAFPVHRNIPDRVALRRAEEVVDNAGVLILFPEGTRREGPMVEDLHEGAAYLSLRSGVPIIPVGIAGSDRAMAKGSKFIRPVRVDVVVGEAILARSVSPSGRIPRSAVRAMTEELRVALEAVYAEARTCRRSRSHVRRMTRK